MVEEINNSDFKDEKYASALGRFKNRHGELGPITTNMPGIVLGQVDGGDDLKRNFIIYITSSLINCPPTRRYRYRLMTILPDIGNTKN